MSPADEPTGPLPAIEHPHGLRHEDPEHLLRFEAIAAAHVSVWRPGDAMPDGWAVPAVPAPWQWPAGDRQRRGRRGQPI